MDMSCGLFKCFKKKNMCVIILTETCEKRITQALTNIFGHEEVMKPQNEEKVVELRQEC